MNELEQESMYGKVSTVKDLGQRIRMKRKKLGFTLKHVAGLSGIGIRYLSELERGKDTIEMGKALSVVNCLGLKLVVQPKSGLKHKDLNV